MMHIVIDNSGSMRDNGKASLAVNVMMMFRRRTEVETGFYKWDTEVTPIDSPAGLDFSGQAASDSLILFLSGHRDEPVVLVGDGVADRPLARKLKESGALLLAVGCNSGLDEMRRTFGADRVFPWADSMACFYTALSEIKCV